MLRLLLMRHSKAESGSESGSDHQRGLSARGWKDGRLMGAALLARNVRPDAVLCSTARRTRETLECIREAITPKAEIRFVDALYRADDYLPIIAAEGGAASTLLVIGHNPSIHRTALSLVPDLSGRIGRSLSASFPTSAIAVFDHPDAWPTIGPGSAELRDFMLPEGRAH